MIYCMFDSFKYFNVTSVAFWDENVGNLLCQVVPFVTLLLIQHTNLCRLMIAAAGGALKPKRLPR